MTGSSIVLDVKSVSKTFGPVVALEKVSFDLAASEITGLVGDNGAGKSTLVKLISGVTQPDDGSIDFDGSPSWFPSPAAARARGIETVYQDLALAENMSVWANVYLGRELTFGTAFLRVLDKQAMRRNTNEMLGRFDMKVPPVDSSVEGLSGGQRQIIAIARAAAWGSKLIIMDEPTAALGVAETRAVEQMIVDLKRKGFSVLIISHNLEQVFRITDRIWVLRRGRMLGCRETRRTRPDEIVSMITGSLASSRYDA